MAFGPLVRNGVYSPAALRGLPVVGRDGLPYFGQRYGFGLSVSWLGMPSSVQRPKISWTWEVVTGEKDTSYVSAHIHKTNRRDGFSPEETTPDFPLSWSRLYAAKDSQLPVKVDWGGLSGGRSIGNGLQIVRNEDDAVDWWAWCVVSILGLFHPHFEMSPQFPGVDIGNVGRFAYPGRWTIFATMGFDAALMVYGGDIRADIARQSGYPPSLVEYDDASWEIVREGVVFGGASVTACYQTGRQHRVHEGATFSLMGMDYEMTGDGAVSGVNLRALQEIARDMTFSLTTTGPS